jgi:hypothetical protein
LEAGAQGAKENEKESADQNASEDGEDIFHNRTPGVVVYLD